MKRVALAAGLVLAVAASSPPARAQDPSAPPPSTATVPPLPPEAAPVPPSPASPGVLAPSGIAVVAVGGATDAAWPLAQAVYSSVLLRPPKLDEAHARVLCGEAPVPGSSQELRDVAESVAAVKGEDAPSRILLGELARRLNVRAVVVVRLSDSHPLARVFLADSGTFDGASYSPDPGPTLAWSAAALSLARAFGNEPTPGPPTPAPALATHADAALTAPVHRGKAFYESGWFWGALGAAAFATGAIFFATRDNGDSTIHLQVQVPH